MSAMNHAKVHIAAEASLDVRWFRVDQELDRPFVVEVHALCADQDLDFDAIVGAEASFEIRTGLGGRRWTGVCAEIEQLRAESAGLATYRLRLVPSLWLLGERTNYRIFQFLSELDVVRRLLGEWGIEHDVRADPGSHRPRKYRVQYGESDLVFLARMLEDAGITHYFAVSEEGTRLVLDDEPQAREASAPPLRYHDRPGVTDGPFATHVEVRGRLRPGAVTVGDLDYRLPSTSQPRLHQAAGRATERRLEQFEYEPGVFHFQTEGGGRSPTADDRGAARTDERAGARRTADRLWSHRRDASSVSFESNVLELAPGDITEVQGHPHHALDGVRLLVHRASIEGSHDDDWRVWVEAVDAALPCRPARVTPRPRVSGLESATVVGPRGEEIYTDEFGRVRVHFHWDRESARDPGSSCWLPTNQPWAGQGFGAVNIPRVGQEVLVEFLQGDPDRPVIVGRVYTETNPVPDPLPRYKHVSGLMSESSPRLVMGASGPEGAGASTGFYGGTPMSPEQVHGFMTTPGPTQVVSPTGTNHSWQGSGLKLDDMSGAENLYLQANRDMHWVVHNQWSTVVGAHRTAVIGTDEVLSVRRSQWITIGVDQDTLVQGNQSNRVMGNRVDRVGQRFVQEAGKSIKVESRDGNLTIEAEQDISLESGTTIELRVKNSVVKIQADMISLEGGDSVVHVNPAQGELAEARAREEAERARAERNARILEAYTQGMMYVP